MSDLDRRLLDLEILRRLQKDLVEIPDLYAAFPGQPTATRVIDRALESRDQLIARLFEALEPRPGAPDAFWVHCPIGWWDNAGETSEPLWLYVIGEVAWAVVYADDIAWHGDLIVDGKRSPQVSAGSQKIAMKLAALAATAAAERHTRSKLEGA